MYERGDRGTTELDLPGRVVDARPTGLLPYRLLVAVVPIGTHLNALAMPISASGSSSSHTHTSGVITTLNQTSAIGNAISAAPAR